MRNAPRGLWRVTVLNPDGTTPTGTAPTPTPAPTAPPPATPTPSGGFVFPTLFVTINDIRNG